MCHLRGRSKALDDARFDRVKERLESWLRRLDEADPYHVLGLPPSATIDELRARFHELSLRHHPDRGGDPEVMRRYTRAYDAVRERLVIRVRAG